MSRVIQSCAVCGGREFISRQVLWPDLVQTWGLSADEAASVDRQQGTQCRSCGCNLRSIALASAIMSAQGYIGTFRRFLLRPQTWLLRALEINEAGSLSSLLSRLPRLKRVAYPEVDMQCMKIADAAYDLVLHSDTLEHVPDPAAGLRECLRILRPGGWCCFTIPIIPGRSSRSRAGLAPSYHGNPETLQPDYLVQTEYGSDFWSQVLDAGFSECRIIAAEHPCSYAIAARRSLNN